MLRRNAWDASVRAPVDHFGEQRIVVNHIVVTGSDAQECALEGRPLVFCEFPGPPVNPPGEYLVIGRLAYWHEPGIARTIGRKEIDLMTFCAKTAAKHVAMRFHAPTEWFGDSVADMG